MKSASNGITIRMNKILTMRFVLFGQRRDGNTSRENRQRAVRRPRVRTFFFFFYGPRSCGRCALRFCVCWRFSYFFFFATLNRHHKLRARHKSRVMGFGVCVRVRARVTRIHNNNIDINGKEKQKQNSRRGARRSSYRRRRSPAENAAVFGIRI